MDSITFEKVKKYKVVYLKTIVYFLDLLKKISRKTKLILKIIIMSELKCNHNLSVLKISTRKHISNLLKN